MKVPSITGLSIFILVGCSPPQPQSAHKADSTLMTDTMPVLPSHKPVDKMPIIPVDTTKSDMPVIKPPDSIHAK